MGKFIDLTGKRFGKLVVIGRAENYVAPLGHITPQWYCNCDCGTKNIIIIRNSLKSGNTTSCGCARREICSAIGKMSSKQNKYDLDGTYGIGYTLKNQPFYFDLEDYDKIKGYCWGYDKNMYVKARNGNKTIKMHRLVMNAKQECDVDHIYHITYDNRKDKLRIVTDSQNEMNSITPKNNSSGTKGVSWDKKSQEWHSSIMTRGDRLHKFFKNKEDAIEWRKKKEIELHGDYAIKDIPILNNIIKMVNI